MADKTSFDFGFLNLVAHGYRWVEGSDPGYMKSLRSMSPKRADALTMRAVTSQIMMRACVAAIVVGGIPLWFAGD